MKSGGVALPGKDCGSPTLPPLREKGSGIMIAQEELKTHRAEFLNLRVFPEGEAPSRGGLSSYLAVEAMYIEKVCEVLRLINGEALELDSFRNVDDSPVAMFLEVYTPLIDLIFLKLETMRLSALSLSQALAKS